MTNLPTLRAAVLSTIVALGVTFAGTTAAAQEVPEASPADVESLDAIMAALYDVISGPAGEARDWDRFRSLFIPGARLIPVGRAADGGVRHLVWSPDEYIAQAGSSLETSGFYEDEIGRTTEQFGMVTHAFSAYQSKRTASDPEPFARGINSIQVLNDGQRYWIVSIFWDSERPGNPIPPRYIGR
jgi:hypothetical protein